VLKRVRAHTNLTKLNSEQTTEANVASATEHSNEPTDSATQIVHFHVDTNQLKTVSYTVSASEAELVNGDTLDADERELWSIAQIDSSKK
jgi:hypothetical protein